MDTLDAPLAAIRMMRARKATASGVSPTRRDQIDRRLRSSGVSTSGAIGRPILADFFKALLTTTSSHATLTPRSRGSRVGLV